MFLRTRRRGVLLAPARQLAVIYEGFVLAANGENVCDILAVACVHVRVRASVREKNTKKKNAPKLCDSCSDERIKRLNHRSIISPISGAAAPPVERRGFKL